jgi:hypothetical protein
MMEHIMRSDGKNDYGLGHLKKDALQRLGQLPQTLFCDPAAYVQANSFLVSTPRTRPRVEVAEAIEAEENYDDILI